MLIGTRRLTTLRAPSVTRMRTARVDRGRSASAPGGRNHADAAARSGRRVSECPRLGVRIAAIHGPGGAAVAVPRRAAPPHRGKLAGRDPRQDALELVIHASALQPRAASSTSISPTRGPEDGQLVGARRIRLRTLGPSRARTALIAARMAGWGGSVTPAASGPSAASVSRHPWSPSVGRYLIGNPEPSASSRARTPPSRRRTRRDPRRRAGSPSWARPARHDHVTGDRPQPRCTTAPSPMTGRPAPSRGSRRWADRCARRRTRPLTSMATPFAVASWRSPHTDSNV